jgi:RND family efflux transporter MFP subunit
MSKKIIISIFGLILVFLILAVSVSRDPSKDEVRVEKKNIDLIVAAKGKVEALEEVDLAPKTLGRLKEVDVKEGDFVKKGDVVAVLENDEVKAQVEQAKANLLGTEAELKEAKQNLIRFNALFKRGIISRSELDSAQMKYDLAFSQIKKSEADLQYAEALLENTYIRAPFSGKIIRRFLDPGETITLEKLLPIVTIADVSKIIVRAEIDETDIRKVKVGQPAVITADAYPGEKFKGKVTEISPAVGKKKIISDNPAEMVDTKVLEVKIELDSGQKLNLGLNVDVTIFVHNKENVLALPLKAVRDLDGTASVQVKKNGSYEEKEVTTGLYDDENVEITSGLKEGDTVLLSNSN